MQALSSNACIGSQGASRLQPSMVALPQLPGARSPGANKVESCMLHTRAAARHSTRQQHGTGSTSDVYALQVHTSRYIQATRLLNLVARSYL
jgi:hypothetical protein